MKWEGNLTVDVCWETSLNHREGCFPRGVYLSPYTFANSSFLTFCDKIVHYCFYISVFSIPLLYLLHIHVSQYHLFAVYFFVSQYHVFHSSLLLKI